MPVFRLKVKGEFRYSSASLFVRYTIRESVKQGVLTMESNIEEGATEEAIKTSCNFYILLAVLLLNLRHNYELL